MLAEVENLIADNEYRALIMSRFIVAPLALKNYGLGMLPSVRLKAFALCCGLGDLPMTLAFAYTGSSVGSLVALGNDGAAG